MKLRLVAHFYLASSSVAPEIRTTVASIIHALTGQG
jgi:hypothetical protein